MSEQRLLPLKKRRETPEVVITRREVTPIVGPLGLWCYPILNTILRFLERLRELRYREYRRPARVSTLDLVRDREGRVIQIVGVEKDV